MTLDWVAGDAARAAVILHPHPDYGGDRFNNVVDAVFRGLPPKGIGAARFDFSSSDPAKARLEALDAIGQVADRVHGPVVLIGYSFGADVATTVDDPRVERWVLIAPPLAMDATIGLDPRPKRVFVPAHDQFSPPSRAVPVLEGWAATTVSVVDGADHFMVGRTAAVVDEVTTWLTGGG